MEVFEYLPELYQTILFDLDMTEYVSLLSHRDNRLWGRELLEKPGI